ncbi:MAG TPA: ABC transporter substrate-binding protein [Ferrovibrio sp.]|jgi:iron complex transport system substrate-binding protein|uniref:ABC transporter substrate-binding protein n=1 Tax=Ferrovibrio sp. TaxID=1917215 RepID=UPI002B4B02EF|nr:ABC transporter substrate-binding protein [Ferrovibrio sp.]HLT78544.1 ABC transporter substrate-binding protein [Ferrovibrio sp.]
MKRLSALALLALLAAPAAAGKPARIASMNQCADELVIRLADAERIRTVTRFSHAERGSTIAAMARAFPANYGLAEEIAGVSPDLVLAGRHTTRHTVALLKQLGFPLHELDAPTSMAGVTAQIRQVGALLEESARAEALAADIERRLRQVARPATPDSPTAIIYRPNGFTVGRESLATDVLRHAGLRNLAAEMGWESYGQIPIEVIISHPPDFIIFDGEPRQMPTAAHEVLHHPALRRLTQTRLIFLPAKYWTCAGPDLIRAIEILTAAVGPT